MKGKILTSYIIFGLCVPMTAGAKLFNSVEEFNIWDTQINGDDIYLFGDGVYSLSHLKEIAGPGIKIQVNGTNVILSVNDSFLGDEAKIFGTDLDIQNNNTNIRLDEDFLAGISGENDNLLQMNFIDRDKKPFIMNSSSDYEYYWVDCGSNNDCIARRYSAAYSAAHQTSAGLTGITSIVQYTPAVLLRPVNVINQHRLFEAYDFSGDDFVSLSPEYYNARDFNNMGLRLNAGTRVTGRFVVGVSAYVSTANFKYGIDDFDYAIYGGNLRALYNLTDIMFLRGVGGLSIAKIKSDTAQNPDVFSSYAGMDFGAKFDFESGLYVSPYVGFGTTNATVLDVHDNAYLMHAGSDVGFKYFMDGVSYSYNLRAGINSDGYVDASVRIGAWTVSDKIGGDVSVGVVDTEFGWSGNFSGNVKLAF